MKTDNLESIKLCYPTNIYVCMYLYRTYVDSIVAGIFDYIIREYIYYEVYYFLLYSFSFSLSFRHVKRTFVCQLSANYHCVRFYRKRLLYFSWFVKARSVFKCLANQQLNLTYFGNTEPRETYLLNRMYLFYWNKKKFPAITAICIFYFEQNRVI